MPDESRAKVGVRKSERVVLVPELDVLGVHVPQIEAGFAVAELDGSIKVGITVDGDDACATDLITPDADTPNDKPFEIILGPAKIEITLEADHPAGEVAATGRVSVQDPILDQWHSVAEVDKCIHYSPAHGSVGGDPDPHPPSFAIAKYGKSRMSSKNVTRIFVSDQKRLIADVGRVCKNALWKDYPDWVFNTVACVGPFDDKDRGSYSDPTSIWFNVFLGYYQIDAPKPDWKRPFGYEGADGPKSKVDFAEIVRLGKSDWNYFSNWMYGVPNADTERFDRVSTDGLKLSQKDEGVIGESSWHRVKIGGVDFVSAYEAGHPRARKLVENSLISFLWRQAFGKPNPKDEFEESFFGASLDADLYMAYWEDDAAFHTVIFGGTAPTGCDPDFLAGQMAAAHERIESNYPKLGFPSS